MRGRKRTWSLLAVMVVGVGLAACGTPDAVKHLSTAQVDNLNVAVVAVEAQGKALVTLAHQVKKDREARIEELYERIVKRHEATAADGFPGDADKKAAAKKAFDLVTKAERTRTTTIARLGSRLKVIEDKIKAVIAYIRKLKDVQRVLDGYLQAERLGDALLGEAMKVPLVSKAIDAVNALKQKVTNGAKELDGLVGSFVVKDGGNNP